MAELVIMVWQQQFDFDWSKSYSYLVLDFNFGIAASIVSWLLPGVLKPFEVESVCFASTSLRTPLDFELTQEHFHIDRLPISQI